MTETDKRWLKWNWGVPDWRDKDAYPKPHDLTLNEWRWEFERRRPEFREAWLLYAERTYRANVEEAETLDADDPNRDYLLMTIDHRKFYAREESDKNRPYFRDPSGPAEWLHLAITDRRTYGYELHCVEDARRHLPQKRVPGVPVQRLAIMFDLTKPLPPQLEEVKATFENWRWIHSLEVEKQRRRQIEKWPTYLRILDALDANPIWDKSDGPCPKFPGKLTWKAIGEAFFWPDPEAGLSEEEYEAQLARATNEPAANAESLYKRAKALRDNFPA